MATEIYVDCDNGGFWISTWQELWAEMWRAVAYSLHWQQAQICECSCKVKECKYCVHECF